MSLGLSPFGLTPFGLLPAGPQVILAYARPNADVTDAGWTNEAGSNVNLYASIDEEMADDNDFIQSSIGASGAADDECSVSLSSVSDPSTSTNHKVWYRYGKRNIDGVGIVDLTVSLVQGTTVIAAWTHRNIPEGPQLAVQTLSASEADAITDYSDLKLRFNRRISAFA